VGDTGGRNAAQDGLRMLKKEGAAFEQQCPGLNLQLQVCSDERIPTFDYQVCIHIYPAFCDPHIKLCSYFQFSKKHYLKLEKISAY
jgi:hypothetical protein